MISEELLKIHYNSRNDGFDEEEDDDYEKIQEIYKQSAYEYEKCVKLYIDYMEQEKIKVNR